MLTVPNGYKYKYHIEEYNLSVIKVSFECTINGTLNRTVVRTGGKRSKKKKNLGASGRRPTRSQALIKESEDILMNSERYNLWWEGPPDSKTFQLGAISVTFYPFFSYRFSFLFFFFVFCSALFFI